MKTTLSVCTQRLCDLNMTRDNKVVNCTEYSPTQFLTLCRVQINVDEYSSIARQKIIFFLKELFLYLNKLAIESKIVFFFKKCLKYMHGVLSLSVLS